MGVIPLGSVSTAVCPVDRLDTIREVACEPVFANRRTSFAALDQVLLGTGKSPVMEKHSISQEAVRKGAETRGAGVGTTCS
uniref:Uncharacterized protein n=1 Tax=viral metagenome TaxID=1070528 RepID=A0A6C0DEK0_9ZZZZ